jgi:hypothetical protein
MAVALGSPKISGINSAGPSLTPLEAQPPASNVTAAATAAMADLYRTGMEIGCPCGRAGSRWPPAAED